MSGVRFLLTVPEIIWEASFGIYCTFKGFRGVPGFFADRDHAEAHEGAVAL